MTVESECVWCSLHHSIAITVELSLSVMEKAVSYLDEYWKWPSNADIFVQSDD